MKHLLYTFIIFGLLFIISPIQSEVKEKWLKDTVEVGQEAIFTLEFATNEIENLSIPEKGHLFKEKEDIPYSEIIDIVQTSTSLVIKIVYFEAGEHELKVQWKEKNQKKSSSAKLKVTSVLNQEKEIVDIEPPIEFSGNYLLRAILIFGGLFLGLIGVSFLAYLLHKKKPSIKDAIVQTYHTAESLNDFQRKLESILKQEFINHKDFIFILSGYIKEMIGLRLGYDAQYMNQDETNEILKSKYKFSDLELLDIKNYFNSIKYMPNDELISRQKAVEVLSYWTKKL